jgi:hypothetical protein
MAVPFAVCIKEEQCIVIRFLWVEGLPGAEVHLKLSSDNMETMLYCNEVCMNG